MADPNKVIIVGAGLFGSVCGAYAAKAGYDVTYVDDRRPLAGSPPSAGLIKPSWLQGFGTAGHTGLKVLDELYGLEDLTFTMRPGGLKVKVHYINPRKVLAKNVVHQRALQVSNGVVLLSDHSTLVGRVLVTAGVWCRELIKNMPPVQALAGSAFLYSGTVEHPTLELWAPYKQIKVFNCEPGIIWTGDSTGVKPESYTPSRQRASAERCERALAQAGAQGLVNPAPYLHGQVTGHRPLVSGSKEGYFSQVDPWTWVATGGGKMGSVLAGYHATRFVEALRTWHRPASVTKK
jgi:hypothetical protein